jgi:Putative auto-transporter adhesin, head GIN domain
MKKFYIIFAFISLTFASFSQKKEKIKGSKVVTIEQKKTGAFENLEIGDDLEVMIIKGEKSTIEIEADDNIHQALGFVLNGKTLRLSMDKNIGSYKKFNIRVTYTDTLKSVTTKNDAVINALQDISLEDVTFKSFDSSKLFLNVKSKKFTLLANDKSRSELNVKSDDAIFELSKDSQTKSIIKSGNLKFDLYQDAKATLDGDVTEIKLRLDNNSEFRGKKLIAKKMELIAEISSTCEVNVSESLSIECSGKSEIDLYGNQKIDLKKFTDTSRLTKKK